MSKLAVTLRGQGDLAEACKLREETLDIQRRLRGPEHAATTISAWNLLRTLQDSGEIAAELAALKRDLLWLLDRDPATLSADQRAVRAYVAEAVEKTG
ncbi:MAG: tetratricopeptide repeat protein [Terriglobales bacterium]